MLLERKAFLLGLILCSMSTSHSFASSKTVVKKADNKLVVSKIDMQNLEKEKKLFITFYSHLYRNVTEHLNIKNLHKDVEERFNNEIALLKDSKNKLTAIKVEEGKNVVAIVVLGPTTKSNQLRVRRCAVDLKGNLSKIVKTLLSYVFEKYPQVTSLGTVCHKKNTDEHTLLSKFGFKPCSLISSEYDKEKYTSFELTKGSIGK